MNKRSDRVDPHRRGDGSREDGGDHVVPQDDRRDPQGVEDELHDRAGVLERVDADEHDEQHGDHGGGPVRDEPRHPVHVAAHAHHLHPLSRGGGAREGGWG